MQDDPRTLILGIETSCDETAAAVIGDGRRILSNVVASQEELHAKYGGVFPEMASRRHIETIIPVIDEALDAAAADWHDIDAIAVTYGPGLVGSLLVGVNTAKGLALAEDLPLIGVNHLEGHIYANWLAVGEERAHGFEPRWPLLALVVSGGHTELALVRDYGNYEVLGRTLDDAAGEAFDKVARMMGLGYPGGPEIQRASAAGRPMAFDFPRAWLPDTYDFSFSGLKTAVLREVETYRPKPARSGSDLGPRLVRRLPIADIAASFQEAVVDVLVEKTLAAADEFGVAQILVAGGVSANSRLRTRMQERVADTADRHVFFPPLFLCTDNAAMIAAAGYWAGWRLGRHSALDLDVVPGLMLDAPARA